MRITDIVQGLELLKEISKEESILLGLNLVNLGEVVIPKNDYLNYY